jgi:integrase
LRIAKGDNILDVSKQLGHSKISMTLDNYAHWMPGEHKSQVDELDNLHLSTPYTHPEEVEGK